MTTRCDIFGERSFGDLRFFQLLLAIQRNVTPADAKRPRISTEECQLDDSDSEQEDLKRPRQNSPISSQQTLNLNTPSPDPVTSPDPDLDVEEETETEAPENLSLKKTSSPETPPQQSPSLLHYHPFPHVPPFQPQYQRSPVDVLLRVFPGRRRSDVEAILQRCKGDVLQAMEVMVSNNSEDIQPTPSAFSPLGPPPSFHRYSPSRRFLSAPYAGTGYLSTVIRPPADYHISMMPPHHDLYQADKATASSPGSNTGSDKTSYSE
ncbi:dmrta motif [Holotrichia oblita]|uniref:Dmrta motif n=1 Tax=Holotrichia oblita TaxID=644536 RepID=A0ACB9TPQ2_HOLOL|nr:dmrta motif [Holotrichia oblita]